ncbi:MAG: hypothetical protein ACPGQL_08740 [Thermoplasmatota archaeon]
MSDPRTVGTVRPFLIGIVLCAALAAVNEYRGFELWRNYALSGIVIGGSITYWVWRADVRVPHYIQWGIVAATFTHYGGGSLGSPDPYKMGLFGFHGVNGAYHHFDWWDHLTHGAGIGAATMGLTYLMEVYQLRRGLAWPPWLVGLLGILCGLSAGVGVELYEYLGKTWFQTIDQGGYINTMRDLWYNLLGASIGATLAMLLNRTTLKESMRQRWAVERAIPLGDDRLPGRIPPSMTGFAAFVAIPAATALFLAIDYLFTDVPPDEAPLYDAALTVMTWSAAAAAAASPAGSVLHVHIQRWIHRRRGLEADGEGDGHA